MKPVFSCGRVVALAFVALFACGARAQAQALECGTSGPVECFIGQVKLADLKPYCDGDVFAWQVRAKTMYTYSQPLPEQPKIHECVKQQKGAVEPYYAAARAFLANNKDGLSALKDAYSYWLASVDQIPDGVYIVPTERNLDANRARRDDRKRGIEDRLNRLALEK